MDDYNFLFSKDINKNLRNYQMHAELFDPHLRVLDNNGKPLKAAKLYFFESGTNQAAIVYKDSGRKNQHNQPVSPIINQDGLFPPIYLNPHREYRAEFKDAKNKLIQAVDPAGPLIKSTVKEILGQPTGSSLIGYEVPSSSSVPRQMDARLNDRYSVKDFGAKGDGSTNDAPAIQAAIDSVEALGGGTLFFPSGFYVLRSPIQIKPRVWLVGAGHFTDNGNSPQTTLEFRAADGAPKYCLKADKNVNNLRIERMLIKCDYSGWQNILYLEKLSHAYVRDCYLSGGPTNAAIFLAATLYTRISSNVFSLQNATMAIDAPEGSAGPGVGYYGTNGSTIDKNTFNVQGAVFRGNGDFTFRENGIEGRQIGTEAKIVITGESVSYPKILNNYVELAHPTDDNKPEPPEALPFKFIKLNKSVNNGTISGNSLHADPRTPGSIAIDLAGAGFAGEIENNWVKGFETIIAHGTAVSRYTFRNNNTAGGIGRSLVSSSPHLGDGWDHTPNQDMAGLVLHEPERREFSFYQTVVRSQWVFVGKQEDLHLRRGNNISIFVDNGEFDRILDAGLYPGAVVTLHAREAFKIIGSAATRIHAVIVRKGGFDYQASVAASLNGTPTKAASLGPVQLRAGAIAHVAITDQGEGYSSTPAVAFNTGGGSGQGAVAIAVRECPFSLYKGKAKCTVPKGSSIQFVVTMFDDGTRDRELLEIGDFSARLP